MLLREEMESVPSSRGQRRGLGGYRCYAPLKGGLYAAVVCKPVKQFSRLKGDETGNWTGPVNVLDDGSLKPARNVKKRCFRQNFQPDSQSSVIVTPCLADIKKKKKRSQ
ncbi:unnamed protein product, partial [Coregonus sp. 'balchen']